VNVDTALKAREHEGRPLRVALIGAGATVAPSPCSWAPPCRASASPASPIARRLTPSARCARPASRLGEPQRRRTKWPDEIGRGHTVLVEDPGILVRSGAIDVMVEATGTVDMAARVTLEAIEHGVHPVVVNAELDSLLGPILKARADRGGVVFTNTDGDEPGVAMTLFRYVRSLGLRPVAAGQPQGHGGSLPKPGHAAGVRGEVRPGCAQGDVVRRCHQAVDGVHCARQRHWVRCSATRHVRPGLQLRR
jgi:predicted homoserine dehydrogenase-like protein